jgi:heat shock protein HslJ
LGCNVQQKIVDKADVSINIMDREWVAVKVENEETESINTNQRPTIKLSAEKMSGHSSCNRFHGTYTMNGNKLTFDQIMMTKMFCPETDLLEKLYMKTLSDVRSWEYKQGKLYFFNQEKEIIIIYKEF